MDMDLKETHKLRLAFLNKLYELSQNERDRPISGEDIARKIGITDMKQAYGIVKYLIGEGLLEDANIVSDLPGYVKITHYGVKQVESADLSPDKPTKRFLPMNAPFQAENVFINHINNMIGSSIQQGTSASQQSNSFSNSGSLDSVMEFIKKLESSIEQLSLSQEASSELSADIDTIKSQLSSPNPKKTVIKELLESAGRILEAAAGSAIGNQLGLQIPILINLL